jgi:hypothetical protein
MTNRISNPQASEYAVVRGLERASAEASALNAIYNEVAVLDRINRENSQSFIHFRVPQVDTKAANVAANETCRGGIRSLKRGDLETTFRTLADRWYAETIRDSSITRILSNESYLRVIELGIAVVPLILNKLKIRPRPWFLVLRILTKEKDIGKGYPGDYEKIAKAWIQWGKERGLTK